ncbi:MAG: sulfatase-like hydrolase/transferase [Odoribacteraceae bacterium]|jgi:phosphoglycerol transferase MdoB-like AlkP superfamily enzyme|nr:sulfatase-like hydrolase/transferase [Odoribacteraceae bacterium]
MKGKLLFWIKSYLFWILVAWVARILFLCYQWEETRELSASELLSVFWNGAPIDLSFGAYIMMLISIVFAAGTFLSVRHMRRVVNSLTALLLFVTGGVIVGDLEIFKNWGYHADATLFLFLETPGKALASTPGSLIAWLLLLWGAWSTGCYLLYRRTVVPSLKTGRGRWWHVPVFLLLGGALVLPARGGLNVAPMNASFVFFHPTNMYANQAALNPAWNFLYEALHLGSLKENFAFMPPAEANRRVDALYREEGEFPRVLNTPRPNVVVLLLETFTSNAWDVMPNMQALAREGIYFSNIYATGNRSDRGISGVISGFPTYPGASLLKYPARMHARPRFPLDMEREGYSTAFYYAGDLNFAGFRSYVTMTFQRFVTEKEFSGEAVKNAFKWGVHDEYMLDRLHDDLARAASPALHVAFTLSSHEPFEVPGEITFPGEENGMKLKNAIAYTDRCLGRFFRQCRESGTWDNTLFVLVADHGTRHIGNLAPHAPEAYKIPLIFTGGAMRVRDSVVTTLGSQTDVVATLLAQLGMDYSRYRYSKNLLNPRARPFAYYAYSHAAALLDGRGACILDLKSRKSLGDTNDPESRATLEAYLQVIETEFKGRDTNDE